MITEQELKEKCTPEDIKWMVELAEGFEYKNDHIWFGLWYAHINDIKYEQLLFSLLIHRAVEGFNKINEPTGNYGLYIDREKITYCNFKLPRNEEKIYKFKDYRPCHLTACEMAIWDCLLNILKQEERDE